MLLNIVSSKNIVETLRGVIITITNPNWETMIDNVGIDDDAEDLHVSNNNVDGDDGDDDVDTMMQKMILTKRQTYVYICSRCLGIIPQQLIIHYPHANRFS
jgi:hypothetical protein